MGVVVLVEIDVVSPAGAASVLRFCDRAMRPLPPSDPDRGNVVWDDRLADPPTFRRALFESVDTLTPARAAGGMTLKNADGGLDPYRDHAWNAIRVLRWTEGTTFAEAAPLLNGLCATPAYDHRTNQAPTVKVDLYDDLVELAKPIQATLFTGANDGVSVFYEGYPDGLKGRPKPLAWGDLTDAHLPPVQVNAGAYVFEAGEGPLQGSEAIFDGGAPAGFADQGDKNDATFDATTPAAASYITNLGRGLIKINGSPVLGLTFGIKGSSQDGYVETLGPIAARILAKAGVSAGRIGASVASLSSTAVCGVYVGEETNTTDLLAWVARSALCAILPDRQGVYQAIPFAPPAATPDVTILADQVLNLEADETVLGPVGEVRVGWGRIYTTFNSGELKASVRNTAEAERLAAEYRYAVLADTAVKARFPRTWRTLTVETALRQEAAATALAGQLQALFGLDAGGRSRRMWRVTVNPVVDGLAAELGQTVRLVYPPRGIAGNFLMVAEEPLRPRRDQAIWTLWG